MKRFWLPVFYPVLLAVLVSAVWMPSAVAQSRDALDRVLMLAESKTGPRSLSVDRGAPGLWQRLLRLQTTASVLYTVAHPDDEQGGVLTYLSRGQGVRTSLLSLNRGEGGANAIGPELFDGLGLIRTEEMLVSDRYYGLDDQYFTTLIDYGYSKNLEEALRQWGRENVLRDVVRVIRINRPLVLVSRFYGSQRDGHGNHEAAGAVTLEAFAMAGDPERFPEQIRQEGLRPWQPLKVYRSNLRSSRLSGPSSEPPDHRWHVDVNSGQFSPWLGESYEQFSALGLSFQRSQNSGRRRERAGNHHHYFERVDSRVEAPDRESGFFDGIDTSIPGIFRLLGSSPPEGVSALLSEVQGRIEDSMAAYSVRNPSAVAPFLVQALGMLREAIRLCEGHDEALFLLAIKERQFQEAINTALGLQFQAVAAMPDSGTPASPFSQPATMGVVIPGQEFQVDVSLVNPSSLSIRTERVVLEGQGAWSIDGNPQSDKSLDSGESLASAFAVTTPSDAAPARRYFVRESIHESRYRVRDPQYLHLAGREPTLVAAVDYSIGGQSVRASAVVYRREANLPYGFEFRELKVAPAVAVNVSPRNLIVPLGSARNRVSIEVELVNNRVGGSQGELALELPDGWSAQPSSQDFEFSQADARRNFTFSVSIPQLRAGTYDLQVVARAGGREYREGYQVIRHRDYDIRYVYRDSVTKITGVDVKIARGLKVGYVMGVGDEVPSGIEQMGADVTLLDTDDLAAGELDAYDTIVVGTRAYAVRQDLINYNQRLLEFARAGGNLIVLYQTQEFVPGKWAAFPADLPRRAEEVSEEDAPVKILAPDHAVFQGPNRISVADFDGWVEQRGSKFFSAWDDAYVPMIETQDQGQEPQRGGWVTAQYGRGHYTYFAYAVHRQVPYSVPGAYRIFANLLSLGR
jgi:LmbE family N-acetylglucosaminyl deacetylase